MKGYFFLVSKTERKYSFYSYPEVYPVRLISLINKSFEVNGLTVHLDYLIFYPFLIFKSFSWFVESRE